MPCFSHVVEEQSSKSVRLDCYISENLQLLSRSQIKARNLKVKINGKDVKLSRLIKYKDHLDIQWDDVPLPELIAQDIPLNIIYEDERCIVVNKKQGMVVHPGAGNRQGTLANALYYRRLNMNAGVITESLRPGIVHRLDKETSGIIIAAYNDETHAFLAEQFKTRNVKKNYIAIVHGTPKDIKGRIETCLARDPKNRKRFTVSANGKNSLTFYKVIKNWKNYSLLLLRPRTGRTHQLRVHLRHIGHPILGDPVYGSADRQFKDATLMLHSKSLSITLPGEKEERVFSSILPERFISIMEKLDKENI
ncbi:MAG: RluA family pseudouridine synthase [Treponema sp.]|nr:RluA family pseudouridine synthase [Treponema sp.]